MTPTTLVQPKRETLVVNTIPSIQLSPVIPSIPAAEPVAQQAAPAPVIPPQPTPEMLAAIRPEPPAQTLSMLPGLGESDELEEIEPVSTQKSAPGFRTSLMSEGGGELARARAIAQRLGVTSLTDDEYDVPTYLRRQQDQGISSPN